MADGYRFPQQSAGSYYYPQHSQHHPRHLVRSGSPSNNIRSGFSTDPPSPSESPDNSSPSNIYRMFSQNQQQAPHGRVNGGPGGRGMPMMYNFQHQNAHQQQHTQHHQSLQQEHIGNGTVLGHHASYSSGVLANTTPNFTPTNLSNGHNATTRGGQAQMINEHWADQLKLHEETKRAHQEMRPTNGADQKPNYYARMKGHESRPLTLTSESSNLNIKSNVEAESEDPGRPSNLAGTVKRQDWLSLDMSGHGFRTLTTPIFAYTFLNELYIASNHLTQLPPAIGQLRHLRHLDVSYNMLETLPPELGMCVYLKQLLLFNNKIQCLPNELGSLYQLEMLGIEGNPLNQSLGPRQKEALMNLGTQAVIQDLREQAPPPLPPAARVMLTLAEASTSSTQERLKVFSYNTLCDRYATTKQYGYTPSHALSWEYRKDMILAEIKASQADFLCLQEIEQESYNEFFRGQLAYFDYKGVFWPKTRARTMSEKDAKKVDGCATFYKDNKYILLDKQLIDFANVAINRPDMKNQHDIFNRVMPRDHIAVVTFFENRLTGTRFLVVNAHIFYDAAYADVKVIQTAIMMENVVKLAEKYARWPPCKDKKRYMLSDDNEESTETADEPAIEPAPSMEYSSTQIPLIMCTDLNSKADSGVYELLANGAIPPNHPDLGEYSYGNFTRDGIQHPFALRSAYANLNGTSDEVPYTNYTPGFTGVIDYIWYSTNALDVTELLGKADEDYMTRVPGWPTYHFPSDHLALLTEFSVKNQGRKEIVKKSHPEPDFGPQRERRL